MIAAFLIGFVLGGWAGIALMCLMFAAKRGDKIAESLERRAESIGQKYDSSLFKKGG
jgi:gas vesicle protein